MDSASRPRQSYRRSYRRNGVNRQRRSQALQRKYQYQGAPSALAVLALTIVVVIVLGYLTSVGLSFTFDFLSSALG